jgi:hypothetical protein
MSDIKRFIFERVSENIITKPWMKSCYRDYQTREIVMAAYPLNYAITLAWMLNLAWQRYRHRESWIDRMIASEARSKIIQLERERDEAREALMKIEDLFIDGTDIYADREKMGIIARNALEGVK